MYLNILRNKLIVNKTGPILEVGSLKFNRVAIMVTKSNLYITNLQFYIILDSTIKFLSVIYIIING